jgi:hypothetical protein
MRNYEAVRQWASTVNATKAYEEINKLKLKYPWLKCDESFLFIEKMDRDLPKILNIILLQEKQNTIQERVMQVNNMADAAIIKAVAERLNVQI